ncbi:MAG TPA: VOC family protein [bacterium]|nr:VOC family protein [bacterium]
MKFTHFGIKCSDIEASLKYYTEVIGLKKLYALEVMGAPCFFLGNDTFEVELEKANSKDEPPTNGPVFGLSHFAFEVDDIDGLAEDLKQRGAEFMLPPIQIRPTRKIAFIKAPDGVLIQLIQDFPEA